VNFVAVLVVVWLLLLAAVVGVGFVRSPGHRRQAAVWGRAAVPLLVVPLVLMGSHVLQRSEEVRRQSFDLSDNERNTLSAQTDAVLDDLGRQDAKILLTGFFPPDQSQWRPVVRALRRYAEASGRVDVRFVDPDQRPALARQYEVITKGDVFVEVAGVPDAQPVRAESPSEIDVTTAVVRAVNGKRTLCWSLGHAERPANDDPTLQTAVARLEANGYEIREGRLAGGPTFLDGCAALVVASPRAAPLPSEVELLDAFLAAGGRMLLLLDPDDAGVDVAGPWAEVAALRALPDEVRDPQGAVEREPRAIAADRFPSSSPITEKLPAALFLGVRALQLPPDDTSRGLTTSELVTASEEATAGPVQAPALGVALDVSHTTGQGDDARIVRTRVAAFGDADWLQNETFKLLGNETLLVRTVNWLVQAPTMVSIPSRLASEGILVLTSDDRRRVDVGVFLVPILVVTAAAATRLTLTARRRR
jgi:hypothetical protein